MNWDALGALGDLIGGFAVVASLIYLAVQVRHSARQTNENTRALRITSRQAVQEAFARWRALLSDARLAELYLRGSQDYSALSRDERFQFGLVAQEMFYAYETLFVQSSGVGTTSAATAVEQISIAVRPPGLRDWWLRNRRLFDHQFAEQVDQLVSNVSNQSAAQQGAAADEPQRAPIVP
jgi:hypothetical protein